MPDFWDDPELKKAAEGGDWFRFDKVGDKIQGTVQTLAKKDFDGRTAVEVEFDDGRKVTFGQVLMMREMYTYQPVPGEQIEVELAEVEKKGAKTLKLFRGNFTRLNGSVESFDQTKK